MAWTGKDDVTERRKMEKALRQQEEFHRYLLESFPDLILVVGLIGWHARPALSPAANPGA